MKKLPQHYPNFRVVFVCPAEFSRLIAERREDDLADIRKHPPRSIEDVLMFPVRGDEQVRFPDLSMDNE